MMQYQNHLYRYFIICLLVGIFAVVILKWSTSSSDTIVLKENSSYNYIIVGGGTVGCVLAAKLSENPDKRVLLIEAGDSFGILSTVPLFATLLQKSKYDWSFKTAPQKYSSFGLHNHSQAVPRGKGLGGSGMINYMIHGESILDDFKNWSTTEWNYNSLLPYIQSNFNYLKTNSCPYEKPFNEEQFCSSQQDEIESSYLMETECKLAKYFSESVKELKNSMKLKYEPTKNTIHGGQRWASYHAFLKPALNKRENLDVVLNTHVTKVIFENKMAIGLETVNQNNEKLIVQSRDDIILSAGTLMSPQILLLSGIGPKKLLNKFNIPVIADLPGVGHNLHDHMNMPLYISINKQVSVTVDKIYRFHEFWNYFFYKQGILSSTPISGMLRGPGDIGLILFGMGSADEDILREVSNFNAETFHSLFPLHKNSSQEGFVFLSTCLQPTSRGSVYLENSQYHTLPTVDPNYLSTGYDVKCIKRAVKLATQIINTSVFQSLGAKIHWPTFDNCKSFTTDPENEDYLECIIRTVALTAHHPGGTCKMGTDDDEMAVVDGLLRVKQVAGLRIMDASILQKPLSNFPNSVLINLAEYAADLVKQK